MDVMTAIAGRRSIRKFQPRAVDDRSLLELIEAAGRAPSPGNRQPWRFVVVRGEIKAEVARLMRSKEPELAGLGLGPAGLRLSACALEQAPVAILVFNTGIQPFVRAPSPFEQAMRLDELLSVGAAVENLLVGAHGLGLGAVWIGWVAIAEREIRQALRRSEELIAAIAVGHPDESPGPRPRMPLQEILEWS